MLSILFTPKDQKVFFVTNGIMKKSFTFLVLGNKSLSMSLASSFIDSGMACVAAVSANPKFRPDGASGLSDWAKSQSVEHFEIADVNGAEFKSLCERVQPDTLLVEWHQILKTPTIDLFPLGVIGTHPSQIPYGRGRHPLHWQIVMGYSEISISFFKMTSEIDKGPLLLQRQIQCDLSETIHSLEEKVSLVGYECGLVLADQLLKFGSFKEIMKPNSVGTTWRKRVVADVEIDCRMSRNSILRLVNSVLPPYLGAKLVTKHETLNVVEAVICNFFDWQFHQIGAVLDFREKSIVLRVDDGPIELFFKEPLSQELRACNFVFPPSHYL